jgi:hypothetical protein
VTSFEGPDAPHAAVAQTAGSGGGAACTQGPAKVTGKKSAAAKMLGGSLVFGMRIKKSYQDQMTVA